MYSNSFALNVVQRKFLSVAGDGEGGERRDNGELQRVANHGAFHPCQPVLP